MAKFNPIQTSFNAGEWSPLMRGRVDIGKYSSACKRLENFIVSVEGPAFTRGGTKFVSEVKDSADRTWFVRFEFSTADSYMLEFGDGYIRFYYNRAQVQVSGVSAWVTTTVYAVGDLVSNGGVNYHCKTAHTAGATFAGDAANWYALTGTIYEIPSPYSAADLITDDGTFALKYAQTGDEIYLVHASHWPRKLSRYGSTRWTLAEAELDPPPFAAENTTTTTIYASAKTGTGVTLTASAATFSASHVGQYIKLTEKDVRDIKLWESGVAILTGNVRRSDGKNYAALNNATTGSNKPTHSEGASYDGETGVQWQFSDPGYGWAKITAYTDTTHVTADVVSTLPDGAVGVGNKTTRWAFQAWNAADGYPIAVTFYRERLVFARGQTLWFSVSADFPNFATEVDGVISADAGFDRTLASDRVNEIVWISPGDALLVGTLGDEWVIGKATTTEAFGPSNCEARRQSTYGSFNVAPQRVGNETMFVQKFGRKVRAMRAVVDDLGNDGYNAPNLCMLARHISKSGIVGMAYQQDPWSILWGWRADGVMIGCTFDREQDAIAWHRHPFAGGVVECVESIPAPDGSRDDVWEIVRYTINGSTKRYIMYMVPEADEETDQEDWFYVDCGLTYSGAATSTITGLDHLEGEVVWVLVDGARHPNKTVVSGSITLQVQGNKVHVGKASSAYLETMDIEGGTKAGTAQGKTKRIHAMTLRMDNSLGGKAGPSESLLEEISYRQPSVAMGSAPPAFTGDVDIEWPGDYDKEATVLIVKDRPMPITVLAVMPQMVVQEGR